MTDSFSTKAKNIAWKNYVSKPTAKAELSRVFFGKDPQMAFDKVKSGLQRELSTNKGVKKQVKPKVVPEKKEKTKVQLKK